MRHGKKPIILLSQVMDVKGIKGLGGVTQISGPAQVVKDNNNGLVYGTKGSGLHITLNKNVFPC
jgi:hypothetical protein